jgi:hypothetical protein
MEIDLSHIPRSFQDIDEYARARRSAKTNDYLFRQKIAHHHLSTPDGNMRNTSSAAEPNKYGDLGEDGKRKKKKNTTTFLMKKRQNNVTRI